MSEAENNKSNRFKIINAMSFGQNIKDIRTEMKLTREELSELSGVSVDYLGKIERGQDIPSLAVCVKIAESLNITIDYLLNEKNTGAEAPTTYEIKLNNLISKMSDNDKKHLVKFLELQKAYEFSRRLDCQSMTK